MSRSLYLEFLTEEEKCLSQLESKIKDQLNRLKVEELTLLKLISNSDHIQHPNTTAEQDDVHLFKIVSNDDDDDLPPAQLNKTLPDQTETNNNCQSTEVASDSSLCLQSTMNASTGVEVNIIPINLSSVHNTSGIPSKMNSTVTTDHVVGNDSNENTAIVNSFHANEIQSDLSVNTIPLNLNSTPSSMISSVRNEDAVEGNVEEEEEEEEDDSDDEM